MASHGILVKLLTGAVHFVIRVGKEISKNTLPTSAGLKMF